MDHPKKVKDLFDRYLQNELDSDGYTELKAIMNEDNQKDIEDIIYNYWDTYTSPTYRNERAFLQISNNLKNIIRPIKKRSFIYYTWRIAASILIILSCYFFYNLNMEHKNLQEALVQEYQIVVNKGERASVILPDGSKVYLNANSSFSYPAAFAIDSRQVTLAGEAFFEVKHNADLPFIVSALGTDIKVHGTSFNVFAYIEEPWLEASLLEGKIEIIPGKTPKKSVFLNPGEKAHYNHLTGEMRVSKTDLRAETAWRRGDIIIRSQPFNEIITQLENFYGIKIIVEGTAPDKLFTGNFHEDEVNQVLINLQQHYNFSFKKTGNDIYLKFK